MTTPHPGDGTGGFVDDALVSADDAFLELLSRGIDPSDGQDELAGMLLGLRDEVNAPAPPVPNIDDLLPPAEPAPTTVFPTVTEFPVQGRRKPRSHSAPTAEPSTPPTADQPATVVDLDERRSKRRVGWFGPALTGAAAATLVIAGGGALIHSSEPGDALWGLNETLFGNHAAVVKLASTLEKADDLNANGDVPGALALLEQAKQLAQEMNAKQAIPVPQETTVTVTQPVTEIHENTVTVTVVPEPHTITQEVTVTQSLKPSAVNLEPGRIPSTTAIPVPIPVPGLDDEASGEPPSQQPPAEQQPTIVPTVVPTTVAAELPAQ